MVQRRWRRLGRRSFVENKAGDKKAAAIAVRQKAMPMGIQPYKRFFDNIGLLIRGGHKIKFYIDGG